MCVGLSDREDWLDLNDRELKTILPVVKSLFGQAAGKAPAPVAGPHVQPALGPAVGPEGVGPDTGPGAGLDVVMEPRGPNIPILAKPPIKVRVIFISLFQGCQHHLEK